MSIVGFCLRMHETAGTYLTPDQITQVRAVFQNVADNLLNDTTSFEYNPTGLPNEYGHCYYDYVGIGGLYAALAKETNTRQKSMN